MESFEARNRNLTSLYFTSEVTKQALVNINTGQDNMTRVQPEYFVGGVRARLAGRSTIGPLSS